MSGNKKSQNSEVTGKIVGLFTRPGVSSWIIPVVFLAIGIVFAVISSEQPLGTRISYALLGFLGSVVSAVFTALSSTANVILREVQTTLKTSLDSIRGSTKGEILNTTRNIADRIDEVETELTRRLSEIEKNIPFPTKDLTPVASAALLKRMRDLNELATLLRGGSFPVKEYQMYWILVDFAEGLPPNLEIDAIASIAINEFDEIYGRAYLDACVRARDNNGVANRRLFIIRNEHLESHSLDGTLGAIRANLECIGDSNVKCILFEDSKPFLEPGLEDFVIFGNEVIFVQRVIPKSGGSVNRLLELVQDQSRVSTAVRIFNSLWEHPKSVSATKFLDQYNQKEDDTLR